METRKNFLSLSEVDQQKYISGVKELKKQGIYSQFVEIHGEAFKPYPGSTNKEQSAAHGGPAFLPWHRAFLLTFERELNKVIPGPDYPLPYWDWIADSANPQMSKIWGPTLMGGAGYPVSTGPFVQKDWQPVSTRDGLFRSNGGSKDTRKLPRSLSNSWLTVDGPYGPLPEGESVRSITVPNSGFVRFPEQKDLDLAMKQSEYDAPPWSNESKSGFRNYLEGFEPNPPKLHNAIHDWVYGQMYTGGSPDDPVFFLHHCYIDMLWAQWQFLHAPYNEYKPLSGAPTGHNLNDLMIKGDWQGFTAVYGSPKDFLDHRALGYQYDVEGDWARKVSIALLSNPGTKLATTNSNVGVTPFAEKSDFSVIPVMDAGLNSVFKIIQQEQGRKKYLEFLSDEKVFMTDGPGSVWKIELYTGGGFTIAGQPITKNPNVVPMFLYNDGSDWIQTVPEDLFHAGSQNIWTFN